MEECVRVAQNRQVPKYPSMNLWRCSTTLVGEILQSFHGITQQAVSCGPQGFQRQWLGRQQAIHAGVIGFFEVVLPPEHCSKSRHCPQCKLRPFVRETGLKRFEPGLCPRPVITEVGQGGDRQLPPKVIVAAFDVGYC
jgi:hypothetical protein